MYQLSGRSVIAMGDPVGNASHFPELVWSYRELCDRLDKRCVFYQASHECLPLYIDLGLSFSKLGEEAFVSLSDFSLEGKKRSEFRQAKNRAQREGASFEVVPASAVAPLLRELRQVSDDWLSSKHAKEKGFSVGAFEDDYLVRFDVAVVRVAGVIVAFANLWPAGDKSVLSIDLMRHSEAAPKAIMDYLFTELMLWGKENGFAKFSLGMAPLSGLEHHPLATLWHKVGNLIFRFGDEFYNFEGLRYFKQKFAPDWEPRYLAAPGGLALPRIMIDATTLISGGVKGVFLK
jgi:phosphatidylglycerol lysyltransferase